MLIKIEVSNDNGQVITQHYFHCVGDAPHQQLFTSLGEPIITYGWDYFGFVFSLIAKSSTTPSPQNS